MCHPTVPAHTSPPPVETREAAVAIEGGGLLPGLLAIPARTPAPAVLVISDLFGRSPFYEHLACRLADAGFVAFTADYFARLTPLGDDSLDAHRVRRRTEMDEIQTLRDLAAAVEWLSALPEVGSNGVGSIGFCMGGTLAFDLAVFSGRLAATVAFYGYPAGEPNKSRIAPPRPLDIAAAVGAPLLAHWGDQDPGYVPQQVHNLDQRLTAAGVEHTLHVYPDMEHGFLRNHLESSSGPRFEAAALAWTRTLGFLNSHLSGDPDGPAPKER
jgi:dienelactone hydrolase